MKKIQVKFSKWSKELEEKVHSDKFEKGAALIARGVAQTLGSIVETQKRISNDMSQIYKSKYKS